jgi:hypothetical protein
MCRIEIIANKSVETDIVEALELAMPSLRYTIIPEAIGKGSRDRKLGNVTWPELNFVLFAYTEIEEVRRTKGIMEALKEKFPNEGITFFASELSIR